jgi:hypothetical protein
LVIFTWSGSNNKTPASVTRRAPLLQRRHMMLLPVLNHSPFHALTTLSSFAGTATLGKDADKSILAMQADTNEADVGTILDIARIVVLHR